MLTELKNFDDIEVIEWIRCPVCGSKTRNKIRKDTVLKNFPLFCPKCKQENLINVTEMQIFVIKVPVAKSQSR
ncbi:MAG: cysteine-rich KTR domain-containing protein [Monoglobaceae bacterium]